MDDEISKPIRVEDLQTALVRWGRPPKTNLAGELGYGGEPEEDGALLQAVRPL